jgi:hypothetical protein
MDAKPGLHVEIRGHSPSLHGLFRLVWELVKICDEELLFDLVDGAEASEPVMVPLFAIAQV